MVPDLIGELKYESGISACTFAGWTAVIARPFCR
jgi:hypothetical protein